MKKYTLKLSLVLLSVFTCLTTAAAITIDDFEGNADLDADTLFVPKSAVTISNSAIGGRRSLYVEKTAGTGKINLYTLDGELSHDQGNSASGYSIITWDGDDTPDGSLPSNRLGLGGINLEEDNNGTTRPADSFVLRLSADLGFDQPVTLKISVYSANNASSIATYTISTDLPLTDITIPFANFTQSPLGGIQFPADFRNVGSIVLEINGINPANDLSIQKFSTNGECDTFPVGGTIYGPCLTCIDLNDTSCFDCKDVPFGTDLPGTECKPVPDPRACINATYDLNCNCTGEKLFDLCNVCDGDNSTCKDCFDIPNGGAVIDQCGICGGDGKSCLDCLGIPNGTAKVDECGVCEGDGRSCFQCETSKITDLLFALDGGAKKHERIIKSMIKQIKKKDNSAKTAKALKQVAEKAHSLQLRNWVLSWTLPQIINKCPSVSFCIEQSNTGIIEEYRNHSLELRQLGELVIKRLKKLKIPTAKFVKQNNQIHADNITLTNEVPISTSVCS